MAYNFRIVKFPTVPSCSFARVSDTTFKSSLVKGLINVTDISSIVFLFYELSGYLREQFVREVLKAFPDYSFENTFRQFLKEDYTGIDETELLRDVAEVLDEILGKPKPLKEKDLYFVEPEDIPYVDVFDGKYNYVLDFLTDAEKQQCMSDSNLRPEIMDYTDDDSSIFDPLPNVVMTSADYVPQSPAYNPCSGGCSDCKIMPTISENINENNDNYGTQENNYGNKEKETDQEICAQDQIVFIPIFLTRSISVPHNSYRISSNRNANPLLTNEILLSA